MPVQDQVDGGPEGKEPTLKKKTYSVEDITAALDEIIVQDEFLRDTSVSADENILPPPVDFGDTVGVAMGGASKKTPQQVADEGLDALSKALQGFSAEAAPGNEDEE